jgi:hypothetical protein
MKIKDVIIAGLVIAVLVLLWLFINEKRKAELLDKATKKLSEENESLKIGYLNLLEKYLKTQEKVGPDVIEELQKLKTDIDHLETSIHVELDSVIDHVNSGKGTKAVKDLAKIVENQLKEKAANDSSFTKNPTLNNLLEHAKNCNWIKPHEHAFGHLLRGIRNQESHELAVQESEYRIGLAIFSGIEIIYSLK